MLGYSVSYFLPEYWAEKSSLYSEKLIPVIDYLLNGDNVHSDKLSEAHYELIDKYQNTANLPSENIKEYIRENGYGYILDFFNPTTKDLERLVYLLVLVHQLKGGREGLELVLNILNIDIDIEEWWESTPVEEENTFTLIIKGGDIIEGATTETYQKFKDFIVNYVYPSAKFKIRFEGSLIYSFDANVFGRTSTNYNKGILTPRFVLATEDGNPIITEGIGSELLPNTDFTSWTAGEPDGWVVYHHDGINNIVSEDAGRLKIVTDGSNDPGVEIDSLLTSEKNYLLSIKVDQNDGDGIRIENMRNDGVSTYYVIAGTGEFNIELEAVAGKLRVKRHGGASTIIIDSISLKRKESDQVYLITE
jgi:hypothetical protein